jgi:hypothetical protein
VGASSQLLQRLLAFIECETIAGHIPPIREGYLRLAALSWRLVALSWQYAAPRANRRGPTAALGLAMLMVCDSHVDILYDIKPCYLRDLRVRCVHLQSCRRPNVKRLSGI